ncbi:MAG: sugar ABC transporter permease [Oscillospiraceae bacterium]|jgi:multiple sugar transport system permease protein|nr:sugar ABC transporter permease [Oscillospiraceae bacterium]
MKKEPEKTRVRRLSGKGEMAAFYLMLAPFALLFFLFTVLPVLTSAGLGFFTYDMISMPKWNGAQNFLRMVVGDEVFPKTVTNTLKFAAVTGPVSFFLSFLLAWFINEFKPLGRSALAFLFYAPALAGNAFFVWNVAFSGDSYGYVNSAMLSLGLIDEPVNWFRNVQYNTGILIAVQLWVSLGVAFLANIAGLQNVNPEMYEAGALDGIRTRWHELWYITLPGMKNILLFGAVMQIQATFSIGSVITSLAGYPSVDNSVDTIVSHLSDVGITRYEMGYAAAISVFLFAMMAVTRVAVGKMLDFLGR